MQLVGSDNTLLPTGFEALGPFVGSWVLPDASARMAKRQRSGMAEIRAFYDAMVPLAADALEWLRNYPMEALPPEGERLLKLMLALAEIAPAVEWYNSPQVSNGFRTDGLRYLRQIPDCAPQR